MKVREGDSRQGENLTRLLYRVRQDQFDRWTNGDQPDVQEYFAQWPELLSNHDAALDLIYSQFCLAESAGLFPTHDEYLSRFPKVAEELAKQFEVHRELGAIRSDCAASDRLVFGNSHPTLIDTRQLHMAVDSGDGCGASQLGRYVLLEKIGHGTFGTVYRALDSKLNRDVALKIPRTSRFTSTEDEERFLREANAVARLDHPGIVTIFDIGRDRGVPFIVTEYIQGTVLSEIVESGRLDFRDAARLVMEVCMAIDHAHGQGIIHRDLKPSNIILTPTDQPRVLDFGLAKSELPSVVNSSDGAIMGAPAYMSPEQATGNGHQADARSDVYSLGVILYQLVTGELPFRGTFQAIVDQVRTREPLDARQLDPEIPRDLNTICMKALAKEPSRRFTSAREMADELKRFLERKPIQSRPFGRIEKIGLWIRRNPGVSILTASVVAALLLGLAVSSLFAVRSSLYASKSHRQNEQLQHALYNHQIALIQHAVGAGQVAKATSLLENSPPEFRRWEWHYWQSTLRGDLRTIKVNANSVLAFQPTGALIAIGDSKGKVRLLNAQSGIELRNVAIHQSAITALSFSPDGSLLLSAGQDGSVRSWSTEAFLSTDSIVPQQLYESVIGAVHSFVFRPDGYRFSMATNVGCWQFRETTTGALLLNLDWGGSSPATLFTPTTTEQLFASGEELVEMKLPGSVRRSLLKHDAAITGLSGSADGMWVVSTSQDRTACLWNRELQSYRTLRGHTDAVLCSAISPCKELVATAGKDTAIQIWDIGTGTAISMFRGHSHEVTHLAFMSNGALLASVSNDGCIKIWNMRDVDCKPSHSARSLDGIGRLAFSQDGRLSAVAAGDGTLRLYDARTWTELQILLYEAGECRSLSFDNHGRTLLGVFDGRLQKWSVPQLGLDLKPQVDAAASTASVLARLDTSDAMRFNALGQPKLSEIKQLECFAVSPSERFRAYAVERTLLATANTKGDTSEYSMIEFGEFSTPISAVTFSGDSNSLALGCVDGSVWICDLGSRRKLSLPHEHTQKINDIAYAPAGDMLLTASEDGTARLWSVKGGPSLKALDCHSASVNSASFDPSGDRILTAADDRMLRLWDTREAVEIMSLNCDPRTQARFTPDGRKIAFALHGGGVKQFDTTLCSYDEKTVRWEAEKIIAESPLLPDALLMLEDKADWSPQSRKIAQEYITSTASTITDAPRRILGLLLIDTPDRVAKATALAKALLRYNPDDSLSKTLLAACLCANGRYADAKALLPTPVDIVDIPTAMIAILVATNESNFGLPCEQRLIALIQQSDSECSADGIKADFHRYFNSVLDRQLQHAKQSYHQAEFDTTHRNLTLVSHFRPLASEQLAMLMTSLAVQRQWAEASRLHSQLEHAANDWVHLANDALLKLAAHDKEGYQAACVRLLSFDYSDAEPTKALLASIACLAGDRGVENPYQLLEFVGNLKKRWQAHPGVQISLGLAQFRCGMLEEAQATLRPMLLLTELAASDMGAMVVGVHSTELKIVQLTCVSTLLQVEQRLGLNEAAAKLAMKTQKLVDELDQLPPVYDGRLGPWNARIAAELASRLLIEWKRQTR